MLSDYRLPGWNGMEAFRKLKERGVNAPFILITGTIGEERAVDCIKQGIADYVLKDKLVRLPVAVERALALPLAATQLLLIGLRHRSKYARSRSK